jgi:hypothetical protein
MILIGFEVDIPCENRYIPNGLNVSASFLISDRTILEKIIGC